MNTRLVAVAMAFVILAARGASAADFCSSSWCQFAPGYCCGDNCVPFNQPACFPTVPMPPNNPNDWNGLYCSADYTPCEQYVEAVPDDYIWACCNPAHTCGSACGVHSCFEDAGIFLDMCPLGPPDPCECEVGDPVALFSGLSSHRTVDLHVSGSLGGIRFQRSWTSSTSSWTDDSPFRSTPAPFGSVGPSFVAPEWSHDALALVIVEAKQWLVRDRRGAIKRFKTCSGLPCWAEPMIQNRSVPDRLQRTATGFVLWESSGERLVFDDRYVGYEELGLDGGPGYTHQRFFLTRVLGPSGAAALEVTYQQPSGLSCPAGLQIPSSGVPYLYELSSPEAKLRFIYSRLEQPDGGPQCVIRAVGPPAADGGVDLSRAAVYAYVNDGLAERPGRIASATLGSPQVGGEAYSYEPFIRVSSGAELSRHTYSSGKVVSDVSVGEWLQVSHEGQVSCPTGSACCGELPKQVTVSSHAAQRGDGTAGDAGLVSQYLMLSNTGQQHQPRMLQQSDSCTVSGSCSPGSTRTEWVCSTTTTPGYEQAFKNKRDNWEAYTWAAVDAGFSAPVLEKRSLARGATDKNGADALETETYTYVYGSGEQLPSTTTRPSVYAPESETVEKRWYDSSNRLVKVTRRGYTRDNVLVHDTIEKTIATFFSTSRTCGSPAEPGPDALGRTLETRGPCFVEDEGASACSGPHPVTVFEYWPSNATTLGRANRLKAVYRYVNGSSDCASVTPLSTLYDDYDALGNARSVTDEAGNVTTYTFDGAGQMLSRTKGANTTSFVYDNGKLSRISYPAGNAELFCYRTASNAGCTSGTWTPLLQWKAKMACTPSGSGCSSSSPSGDWSELIAYSYAPDGTVSKEEYRSCATSPCAGPAAGELRREVRYSADAHRRPTWRQVGGAAGQYSATSFFDRADNLAGVGLPFNGTPAFCGGPASGAPDTPDSKLCAALKYDRAERLASFTEYPTGASGSAQSTCFGYDAHGNVNVVTPGCTSSCDDVGTCDGDWKPAIEYTWDDFGNLATVHAPWTSGTSGMANEKAATHYFHDARGNVVHELNPVQSQSGAEDDFIATSWDMVDRPTLRQVSEVGGTLHTLWEMAYGQTTSPTNCPSVSNTGGRLSSRVDAYGSTFYAYDVEGRVTKEVRIRAPDTQCSGTGGKHPRISPHTFYTYDLNGNLTAIEYPHGRTVSYLYGTGGNRDRVTSVEVTRRESNAWSTKSALDAVQWEPYGGLRGYRVRGSQLAFSGGTDFNVEYLQGDNGTAAPTSICPSSRPSSGNSDFTGRMRALFVSRFDGGVGAGDIYRRWYTYQADVPTRVESCLLNETSARVVDYGYDKTLRLTSIDGGYPVGPTGVLTFSYDARGNRTAGTASGQPSLLTTTNSLLSKGWLDKSIRSDGLHRTYQWDSAGRLSGVDAIAFRPNGASARGYDFDYFHGAGLTFHAFGVDGLWYNYAYDAFNRRVTKMYPHGGTDDFFYDLGHQMLAEEGFGDGAEPRIVYDYVWLGGRPVLVVRGLLMNNVWQADSSDKDACSRDLTSDVERVGCGFYALVTDAIGAPVLMVDSAGFPTGVNDSDPFGYPNRGVLSGATAQPYPHNQSGVVISSYQLTSTFSGQAPKFVVETRARAAVRELVWPDEARVECGYSPTGVVSGAGGPAWTTWARGGTESHSSTCNVKFTSDATGRTDGGVVLEAFEYRRYDESGAGPFFTSLRFPGQYHDAESDLFENWNRYYDPFTGRYLQPEPVLHDPWWPKEFAQAGHSLPTYAYALNNPVKFTDPDGQVVPLVIGGGILISEIIIPAVIAGLATAMIVESECEKDKVKRCTEAMNQFRSMCRRKALENFRRGGGKPWQEPTTSRHPDLAEAFRVCDMEASAVFKDCMGK